VFVCLDVEVRLNWLALVDLSFNFYLELASFTVFDKLENSNVSFFLELKQYVLDQVTCRTDLTIA